MNNRQTIKDLRLELERFAFVSRNVHNAIRRQKNEEHSTELSA